MKTAKKLITSAINNSGGLSKTEADPDSIEEFLFRITAIMKILECILRIEYKSV